MTEQNSNDFLYGFIVRNYKYRVKQIMNEFEGDGFCHGLHYFPQYYKGWGRWKHFISENQNFNGHKTDRGFETLALAEDFLDDITRTMGTPIVYHPYIEKSHRLKREYYQPAHTPKD